jgi:phage-related minor tail protein
LTTEELFQRGQFNRMKKEIESIYEQLVDAKEVFVIVRLESKLEHLTRKIAQLDLADEDTVTSLSALIKKASEERGVKNIKAARAHNVANMNRTMNPWGKIMGRGGMTGRL